MRLVPSGRLRLSRDVSGLLDGSRGAPAIAFVQLVRVRRHLLNRQPVRRLAAGATRRVGSARAEQEAVLYPLPRPAK